METLSLSDAAQQPIERHDLDSIPKAIKALNQGLSQIYDDLIQHPTPPSHAERFIALHENVQRIEKWVERIPAARMRALLCSFMKNTMAILDDLSREGVEFSSLIEWKQGKVVASFLMQTARHLGPKYMISQGGTTLFIKIPDSLAHCWNADSVAQWLEKSGIQSPINNAILQTMFRSRQFGQWIAVSQSKEPGAGADGTLADVHGMIELNHLTPVIAPAGRPEPPPLFWIVEKGKPIVKKNPPGIGEDGRHLFGNRIPGFLGYDPKFPMIPFTAKSPSGLELLSTINGCAVRIKKRLHLIPAQAIAPEAAAANGVLISDHSIYLEHPGPPIKSILCKQHVFARGDIRDMNVKSGGHLFIDGMLEGTWEQMIQVGGRLATRFLSQVNVECEDQVICHGQIVRSNVAARRIRAVGSHAKIIGGTLRAWDDLEAAELGSDSNAATEIILGGEERAVDERLQQVQKLRDEKKHLLRQLQTSLHALNKKKSRMGSLMPDQESKRVQLSVVTQKIEREMNDFDHRIKALMDDLESIQENARMVRARAAVYPGVMIRMLDQSHEVKKKLGATTFVLKNGQIVLEPFQERNFERDASALRERQAQRD